MRVALRDGFVGWRFLGVTEVGGQWWVAGGGWLVVRGEEWGAGEWLSGEVRGAGCGLRVGRGLVGGGWWG